MHKMALNFSHRPIFQAHLSEDNLVAPMRIGNGYLMESISEKSGDGFGTTWHDVENCFDYGRDICDKTISEESVSKDILDLLPSDPFGMDISTTFTAITGWLEDLEIDYGKYTSDEAGESDGNYQLFAGLNLIWNNAILFHAFPGNTCIENKLHILSGFGECSQKEVGVALSNDGFGSACDMGEGSQKEVGVALSNDGFGSACDMGECPQKEVGVALSNDGFGSACDMGECSQKEVGVALSNDGFGSACDMGECSPKEVGVALSNDGFGSACDMGEGSQKEVGVALSNDGFGSACGMCDMLGLSYKDEGIGGRSGDPCMDIRSPLEEKLAPHSDLSDALGYLGLGVRDLLVVETVCKSLHSTVRGDPFLWTKIHVEQPLNEKLTDDLLVKLTNRAQGHLQCLSLVECTRITDDGLKRVLESNPKLTKLSVPGCTRLSIEGTVSILKAFKFTGTQGVKHLRIGGLYGVTHKHFEELKLLLGTNGQMPQHSRKLHFYRRGNLYLSYDDDRAIDIELCPRCQNLRLVYDCPAESCQGTGHTIQVCRACTLCIARCSQCGQCINDNEYEETFCLELLCSCCSRLVKCRDGDAV